MFWFPAKRKTGIIIAYTNSTFSKAKGQSRRNLCMQVVTMIKPLWKNTFKAKSKSFPSASASQLHNFFWCRVRSRTLTVKCRFLACWALSEPYLRVWLWEVTLHPSINQQLPEIWLMGLCLFIIVMYHVGSWNINVQWSTKVCFFMGLLVISNRIMALFLNILCVLFKC